MRDQLFPKCLLVAVLLSACQDNNEPRTGALRVLVVTTGGDLDLNGYVASVDGGAPLLLATNSSAVIADLPTGSHDVALTDVAPNCTLSDDNPRAAVVAGGDTTDVGFAIGCVATGVRVTTTTTGLDLDPDGYVVSIDGGLAAVVGVNGTTEVTRLAVGSHTVVLTALAPNCPVTGDTVRSVNLALGQIEPIAFNLTCTAATGVIEVATMTTGIDLDGDGYTVRVDGGTARALLVGAVLRFDQLGAGDHEVTLGGAAANCAIAGDTTRTLAVSTGGMTRDTARMTFAVTCVAVSGLIEVSAATSGVELDGNGYTVRVDSGAPQPLGINGTARFGGLSGGDHSVLFTDAAGNCTTAGENPRTVSVTVGGTTRDTARTTFVVTCVATTGSLKVTTTTSGAEIDPNGYVVFGDEYCDYYYGYYCYYSFSQPVPANGIVTITALATGEHTVLLGDVAPNCTVGGQNAQTVSVPPADTVEVAYAVTCYARATLRIAVTTTGADPDTSGYAFSVNGPTLANGVLATNDTTSVPGLLAGNYQVSLNGVAGNCSVAGGPTHAVAVPWADTTEVVFTVSCVPLGSLEVTVATTGTGLDADGYTIVASGPGGSVSRTVAINGTVTIGGLAPGAYQLSLGGVAFNCSVGGLNPRTVPVPSGATGTSTFDVTCVAPGSIEVTTSTTGVDLDPTGYTVTTSGGPGTNVPTNGTVTINNVRAGDYLITLGGASMNCDVAGLNPRTVSVPSGGTVAVTFDVSCASATLLAIVRNGEIYSIKSNGADLLQLTTNSASDLEPAWSPGGAKIAFTSFRDGTAQVYSMDANGANQTRLTTVGSNERPTWSPDGSKIAFVSWRNGNGEIYVMDANGANQVNVTNNAATDLDPAWSPDGGKIAFVSTRNGAFQLYVMNVNGSNVTRLTFTGQADYQPDWSPDGSHLAIARETSCEYYYGYYCTYELVLVNADGSGEAFLSVGGSATEPVWSPDGQWIALGAADYYAVWVTRVDGTRVAEITPNATQPAWRRP